MHTIPIRRLATALCTLIAPFCAIQSLHAGSATWNPDAASNDWYTASNWEPATIPNGPADVATFGPSRVLAVTLPNGSTTELDSLVYAPGAGKYSTTISGGASLNFTGTGVTNNSGKTDFAYFNFNVHGDATAGAGTLNFFNNATVQSGTFGLAVALNTLEPDPRGNPGGKITFHDDSSPGNAYLTDRGEIDFYDRATLGGADVTCFGATTDGSPGGIMAFFDESSTGLGSVILNSGSGERGPSGLYLCDDSSGAGAQLEMIGTGFLDLSGHHPPGAEIDSLQGNSGGIIFLGSNNLTVTRTIFDFEGVIQDGGIADGTGGSLTKTGDAYSVTLASANTYTGGTVIKGGTLIVQNKHGSGTGTGPVQLEAGVLGGNGTIAGDVTVGGSAKAILAPGKNAQGGGGSLIIRRSLTFNAGSTLKAGINSASGRATSVRARGVTIAPGTTIDLSDRQGETLPAGTTFTLIANIAQTPITDVFDNLADGATIMVGANTFQANYEGGDGNDLTLTVVQ